MNVTALIDTAGDVVERYGYDPYGQATVLEADWTADGDNESDYGNTYLFQGRRWDTESDLYCFRNRTYSPRLGRFIQRDPVAYIDGMNLYGFWWVVFGSDPSGLNGNTDRMTDWYGSEYGPRNEDAWRECCEIRPKEEPVWKPKTYEIRFDFKRLVLFVGYWTTVPRYYQKLWIKKKERILWDVQLSRPFPRDEG
jgi:RHS repeat-associated protein